jgi:GT2 family glycosyltransferase
MHNEGGSPWGAIIILNWNHVADTLSCIHSVNALDYSNKRIIVVDNGSTDDSVTRIKDAYPDIHLIETGRNLGYSGGNNVGIQYALRDLATDYVWLLNDDVLVASDALTRLVEVAEMHPQAGFLGPMVYIREHPDHILSAGGILGPTMDSFQRGLGELDQGKYEKVDEVDFLSGCALFVSRKLIEEVGALDESFFAYYEDVDWCYRGKQAGFDILFVPQSVVWHPDTRYRDEHSASVMYYMARNHLLFLSRNHLGIYSKGKVWFRYAKWLVNWTFNPKWRDAKPKRDALMLAMRDFVLGRFGKGPDF